ncbi:hypothetical protein JTB14_019491 [Gonioctena quinquepunctata]|nr:hypothetical protein JTB14_019491 [Gonioctena quinquepunctata]
MRSKQLKEEYPLLNDIMASNDSEYEQETIPVPEKIKLRKRTITHCSKEWRLLKFVPEIGIISMSSEQLKEEYPLLNDKMTRYFAKYEDEIWESIHKTEKFKGQAPKGPEEESEQESEKFRETEKIE